MVQPCQAANAQTAVRTSSNARMSRSQRNGVLQRAMSSRSRIGLKRWRVCCRGYVSISIMCHPLTVSRSSIPEQTLHKNSALPSNVTSGLGIPLPSPRGQRRQTLPQPSQKIPSAPFPSLRSLVSDLKSQNPRTLMKKRVDPLGILQFPRTCPVSRSQTSRDGTTAALPCSL